LYLAGVQSRRWPVGFESLPRRSLASAADAKGGW
jgi:hypothetical protein